METFPSLGGSATEAVGSDAASAQRAELKDASRLPPLDEGPLCFRLPRSQGYLGPGEVFGKVHTHTPDGWQDGTNEACSLPSRLFLTLSLSDTPSVKLMVNSSTLGTFSLFFSVWYSVRVFTTTCMTKVTYSAQRFHRMLLKM